MSYYRYGFAMALAMGAMSASSSRALAVSYASNITKTGTTVNFILNSPADVLSYSINGGAPIALDGTTKGAKTFNLTSASDTFSIIAERNDPVGFTIPTGTTIATTATSLTQDSAGAGLTILSDDASPLNRFNSPRGLGVSRDPNASNFGSIYITNSVAGSVTATVDPNPILPARNLLEEGVYALRADGSDAFGYGDTAKNPGTNQDGFPAFSANSANSPYRIAVGPTGEVYVADYSDINGTVFKLNSDLSGNSDIVLAGIGGPGWNAGATPPTAPLYPDGTSIPPEQNHGSISSLYIDGSLAGGDLVVYGVDEDINSAHFGGTAQNDRNSIWRWDVGGTANSSVTPTKIGGGMIGDFPAGGIAIDMDRGDDGKFYLSQYRSAGLQVGIQVLDENGVEVFNSLTKTRELSGVATTPDIFANVHGISVSPDQQWLAAMLINNDIAMIPLVDGIPDIENRIVVDSPLPATGNGRDVAFDAAGNLHYVSSGQGVYRVLAPGGHSIATTTWDGTKFVFGVETVGGGGLDGDFNGDEVVDGADFLVWQRGGSPNPLSTGDLDLWKANYGQTAAAPAVGSVPEPSAALLAMGGVAALGFVKRRR
jgi:hypothetical protein